MLARLVFALTALLWAACLQAQDYTVYVIDTPNFGLPPWQILQYDRDGRNPEVFIDHHLEWPHDILFLEDAGTVLVSNYNSGTVERFDAATG